MRCVNFLKREQIDSVALLTWSASQNIVFYRNSPGDETSN